jgi:hypothetical protein
VTFVAFAGELVEGGRDVPAEVKFSRLFEHDRVSVGGEVVRVGPAHVLPAVHRPELLRNRLHLPPWALSLSGLDGRQAATGGFAAIGHLDDGLHSLFCLDPAVEAATLDAGEEGHSVLEGADVGLVHLHTNLA